MSDDGRGLRIIATKQPFFLMPPTMFPLPTLPPSPPSSLSDNEQNTIHPSLTQNGMAGTDILPTMIVPRNPYAAAPRPPAAVVEQEEPRNPYRPPPVVRHEFVKGKQHTAVFPTNGINAEGIWQLNQLELQEAKEQARSLEQEHHRISRAKQKKELLTMSHHAKKDTNQSVSKKINRRLLKEIAPHNQAGITESSSARRRRERKELQQFQRLTSKTGPTVSPSINRSVVAVHASQDSTGRFQKKRKLHKDGDVGAATSSATSASITTATTTTTSSPPVSPRIGHLKTKIVTKTKGPKKKSPAIVVQGSTYKNMRDEMTISTSTSATTTSATTTTQDDEETRQVMPPAGPQDSPKHSLSFAANHTTTPTKYQQKVNLRLLRQIADYNDHGLPAEGPTSRNRTGSRRPPSNLLQAMQQPKQSSTMSSKNKDQQENDMRHNVRDASGHFQMANATVSSTTVLQTDVSNRPPPKDVTSRGQHLANPTGHHKKRPKKALSKKRKKVQRRLLAEMNQVASNQDEDEKQWDRDYIAKHKQQLDVVVATYHRIAERTSNVNPCNFNVEFHRVQDLE